MHTRHVLVVDGLQDLLDESWLTRAVMGDQDRRMENERTEWVTSWLGPEPTEELDAVQRQRALWSAYRLRPTVIDFREGASPSAAAAVRDNILSGAFGAVLLSDLSGAELAVEKEVGEALVNFVRKGGALCVLSSNASFAEGGETGGIRVLARLFGSAWHFKSYTRCDQRPPAGNAQRIARCFGGASPLPPHEPLSALGYYTKQTFLGGVPPEERCVQDPAGGADPAVGVAFRAFGAGHLCYANFVNPSNPVPELAVRFLRHAGTLDGSAAWSVAAHAGFPRFARMRAAALLLAGVLVARAYAGDAFSALVDAWRDNVIPRCVAADWATPGTEGTLVGLRSATQWNGRRARVVLYSGDRLGVHVVRDETPPAPATAQPGSQPGTHGSAGSAATSATTRGARSGVSDERLLVRLENFHVHSV